MRAPLCCDQSVLSAVSPSACSLLSRARMHGYVHREKEVNSLKNCDDAEDVDEKAVAAARDAAAAASKSGLGAKRGSTGWSLVAKEMDSNPRAKITRLLKATERLCTTPQMLTDATSTLVAMLTPTQLCTALLGVSPAIKPNERISGVRAYPSGCACARRMCTSVQAAGALVVRREECSHYSLDGWQSGSRGARPCPTKSVSASSPPTSRG